MRDSMKITVPYQFGRMLLTHLGGAAIAWLFQMIAFWYFIEKPIFKEIVGVIFTAIYCGIMYRQSHRLSEFDYKSYTPLKPHAIKGFLFGVLVALVTFVFYLIYRYIWSRCVGETGLTGIWAILYNMFFLLWNFPFYGIMGASNGHITAIGHIAMYAAPILSCTAGYLAGKYKFDIIECLRNFTYEKPTK